MRATSVDLRKVSLATAVEKCSGWRFRSVAPDAVIMPMLLGRLVLRQAKSFPAVPHGALLYIHSVVPPENSYSLERNDLGDVLF